MKKTIIRTAAMVSVAALTALGLAACGGDNRAEPLGSETTQTEVVETEESSAVNGEVSEAFITDMSDGVAIINEKIAEQPGMSQIMLASDVDRPTQKYGMWVMPYHPSEAVESYIQTVQLDGDQFHMQAVDAETGATWQMDQDGNVVEVAE